jgi:hypothetical protein
MNCIEVEQNLIFLAEGSLRPGLAETLLDHIAACNACKQKLEAIQYALTLIGREKIRNFDPYFSSRIMERIKKASGYHKIFRPSIFFGVIQPALALMVIGAAIYTGILLGEKVYPAFQPHENEWQVIADDFYLNDLGMENIESAFITQNN